MTPEIIAVAVQCSMIERNSRLPEVEKLPAVSFALLDVIDACVEAGLIGEDDPQLPKELDLYLNNVYSYLEIPRE